jgi:hypothetical protein
MTATLLQQTNADSYQQLQRALYLNLARCYLKRVPHLAGWSIRMASLAIGISSKQLRPLLLKQEALDQSSDLSLSSLLSHTRESESLSAESTFLLIAKRVLTFLWISISSILARFGFPSTSNREIVASIAAETRSNPRRSEDKNMNIKYVAKNEEEMLVVKQLVDGYFMRGKALLAASRPQLAKKVASVLHVFGFSVI